MRGNPVIADQRLAFGHPKIAGHGQLLAGGRRTGQRRGEDLNGSTELSIGDQDRQLLLDWLVSRFGPETKPFPRTYVAREITTFFSDNEAEALLSRACSTCHPLDRVNSTRNSADAWRVLTIDMRERGARLTDEEVEKLVEWLGRTKGTNANQ